MAFRIDLNFLSGGLNKVNIFDRDDFHLNRAVPLSTCPFLESSKGENFCTACPEYNCAKEFPLLRVTPFCIGNENYNHCRRYILAKNLVRLP